MWKVGALLGFGECAWEEKEGKLRKITILAGVQQGRVALAKAMSPMLMDGGHEVQQFDVSKLVACSGEPNKATAEDLKRMWGASKVILPANGNMLQFGKRE
jgi:hypothetical protein